MDCSTGKERKEGGKNRDKKIVMIKLITEEKNHQVSQQLKVQFA
jgi:hypothetical protein